MRMGSFITASMRVVIGKNKVRGDIALSNCDASTMSMVISKVWESPTVMTPSLPNKRPWCSIGDLGANLRVASGDGTNGSDLLLVSTGFGQTLSSRRRRRVDGLADTAADGQRVSAGGDVLKTVVHDGLGKQGRGGAVTHGVVGLGGDLFTSWAPMFSMLSSSSISLATETPSLVTVGAPAERRRQRSGPGAHGNG